MKNVPATLVPLQHGRLIKKDTPGVWNMACEWKGAILMSYKVYTSNWDKGIHIWFCTAKGGRGYPTFTLTLQPPMTQEEVNRVGETYMTLLNLRNLGT